MPTPALYTFADLVDALCINSQSGATEAGQRDVRMACVNAYRLMGSESDWGFYKRAWRIHLQAPYSTGTLAFDFTGGAHERLVTFSTSLSSAVQAWVYSGRLLISDQMYEVESLKSSTTVTLTEGQNPGADASSGTSFTLLRSSYDMPGDFRGAWTPIDNDRRGYTYVPPQDWQKIDRLFPTNTTPLYWTVMPSENSYGAWSLRVHGYPSETASLDFMYQGRPRPIRYTGYETNSRAGTVTISAGATTVTGTSTAFHSGMIGSIIRVSSDTSTDPTGIGDLNPWAEQKVITAVSSTTALTVDSAFASAYTATKYNVSDPLDVDESLYDLVLAGADMELARIRRHERLGVCIGVYKNRRTMALENDSTFRERQFADAPIYPWGGGYDPAWRNFHPEAYS